MDLIYWIFILIGAIAGMLIFYYLVAAAVKAGILEANGVIEKAKLESRLAELKAKQESDKKA